MEPEIRKTEDGSETVFSSLFKERYHSRFGAVTESMHVFVRSGLQAVPPDIHPVHILEIGFGTGLNALLTAIETESKGISVGYDALEPFPLQHDLYMNLRYTDYLKRPDLYDGFIRMHSASPDKTVQITPLFSLTRIKKELKDFTAGDRKYHLVYFDAFSPEVQPELWTTECFRKLYTYLVDQGILVTYCSKGAVKRSLAEAGFQIERLPGPPGKRHMLRAIK